MKTLILLGAALGFALALLLLGLPSALLMASALALFLCIGLIWNAFQSLDQDRPLELEEALELFAATPAEEQKRAIFRALRDLEYEHTVGKLTNQDYVELSAQFREQAKQLIYTQQQAQKESRQQAEELLLQELNQASEAKKARS